MPYFQYVGKDDHGRTIEGERWSQKKESLAKDLAAFHLVTFEVIGERAVDKSPLSVRAAHTSAPVIKETTPPPAFEPPATKPLEPAILEIPISPKVIEPAVIPEPLKRAAAPLEAPVKETTPVVISELKAPTEPAELDADAAAMLEALQQTASPKPVKNGKLGTWLMVAPALVGAGFVATGLALFFLHR